MIVQNENKIIYRGYILLRYVCETLSEGKHKYEGTKNISIIYLAQTPETGD